MAKFSTDTCGFGINPETYTLFIENDLHDSLIFFFFMVNLK